KDTHHYKLDKDTHHYQLAVSTGIHTKRAKRSPLGRRILLWHTDFGHLIGVDITTSFNMGEQMARITRKHFSPAFQLEAAQPVVD
ncbi:MAG: hypothetical protein ACJATP_002595, partial [Candidatus Azotimanducaceae bacterium]